MEWIMKPTMMSPQWRRLRRLSKNDSILQLSEIVPLLTMEANQKEWNNYSLISRYKGEDPPPVTARTKYGSQASSTSLGPHKLNMVQLTQVQVESFMLGFSVMIRYFDTLWLSGGSLYLPPWHKVSKRTSYTLIQVIKLYFINYGI